MRRAITRVAQRRPLSTVRVERVDKHIAVVTLDRPEKLNALDMAARLNLRQLQGIAQHVSPHSCLRACLCHAADNQFLDKENKY